MSESTSYQEQTATDHSQVENGTEAGRGLAARLQSYAWRQDVAVVGLAHCGTTLASEIATNLGLPLSIIHVQLLYAGSICIGAVSDVGQPYVNKRLAKTLGLSDMRVGHLVDRELGRLRRSMISHGSDSSSIDLKGRTVLLILDVIPERADLRSTISLLRGCTNKAIVLAVPTANVAVEANALLCDDVVALSPP